MKRQGFNMEQVRRQNRSAVLRYINDHGPTSRKDLAEALGLTQASLTLISTELLQEQLLIETPEPVRHPGAGRKKVLLDIHANAALVLAINIGVEETVLAVTNLAGSCHWQTQIKTKGAMDPQAFLQSLAAEVKQSYAAWNAIAAIGVSITGIVDKETGESVQAYGIWNTRVPVCAILQQEFSVPVYLENNVNAFALAEIIFGIGRTYDNLMIIKWGPGVGCAMVIDQKVYEGRHAKAAELGHFIVDKEGEVCACGRRGCLETKISYRALNRIHAFSEAEFGRCYEVCKGTKAGEAFEERMDIFARSIVNSATIMAPNRIVLTGSLFQDAVIREAVREKCEAYDPRWGRERMAYSDLADRENIIGSVALCVREIFFA